MELLKFTFFTVVPDCIIARWGPDIGIIFCNVYNMFLLYFYFCILKFVLTFVTQQIRGGNKWMI